MSRIYHKKEQSCKKQRKQEAGGRQRTGALLWRAPLLLAAAALFSAAALGGCQKTAGQAEQPAPAAEAEIAGGDPAAESGEPGDGTDIDSVQPKVSGERKSEDFYTILVFGPDEVSGSTDVMMLVSYDVTNQQATVMSFPRDTLINSSGRTVGQKMLNAVYNRYGQGEKGVEGLKTEVSELVGFVPDYYVEIDWSIIGKMVEAIGGVWFDVPRDMYYNDLSQNFKIDLKAGYQLLDGDQAMQLLRYRHDSDDNGNILGGYPTGDLGRIEVQQDFLKATIEQCLANVDVGNIAALARVFLDNVTADGLSLGNLIWFAQQAMVGNRDGEKLSIENVEFVTMPCTGQYVLSRTSGRQSYVLPNVDELVELVNERFNPYVDDLREDELDIMYVNSDGTLGDTGGTLEDTRYNPWILERNAAAAATPTPTATPEPTLTPTPATATPEPSPSEEPSASPSGGGETQPPAPPPAQTQEPSPPPATAEPTPETSEEPAAGQGEGGTVSVLPAMPTPVQP